MPDSQPQPPARRDRLRPPTPPPSCCCGARLTDGRTVDVRLSGGRIEAVGTAGSLTAPGSTAPARGPRRLPAAPRPRRTPRPRRHRAHRRRSTAPRPYAPQDVQRRTTEAALLQLGHGATALRTHVRIGDVQGLGRWRPCSRPRRALRGLTELSAVAVPRAADRRRRADGLAMLRDAVKMGAAVVGGCPDLDPDPTGYAEAVLEVAAEHGCPVDLHTDGDDPARLARLAAMAGGLRPGVTIGPCGGLVPAPARAALRTADQLAAAGVTVVCLPQGGCAGVQRQRGHGSRYGCCAPPGYGSPRAAGPCGTRANPVGRGDPLEAAYLLASQAQLPAQDAYEAVPHAHARAMGLAEVRVEAGSRPSCWRCAATRLARSAVARVQQDRGPPGRVVARTSAVREYCDPVAASVLGTARARDGRTRTA